MTKPVYSDLHNLPEDDRIELIGQAAESGKRTAFMVESEEKASRYIEKLTSRFNVEVVNQFPGPVENVVTVIIEKKTTVH